VTGQGLEVLRVIELKRRVPKHADPDGLHFRLPGGGRRGRDLEVRCLPGQAPDGRHVEVFLRHVGQLPDRFVLLRVLRRRHEPEMPLRQQRAGHPRHGPEHGHAADPLDGVANDRLVSPAADPVEHDAPHGDLAIETLAAQYDGGDRACCLRAINDEDHRGLQEPRQPGRAVGALGVHAVVQPAVALDDGDVGIGRGRGQRPRGSVRRHEKQVEVPTGRAGGRREPGRVDVVRPLLEGRHVVAPPTPRGSEPEGDERLAAAPAHPGDQNPGDSHGITPYQ
jgi:hypothetical protein